ncbi:hypothetical protein FIBSPDRAFT_1035822 [Athelia psychrophila]|uniref:BTB domain-containing protein n=1 Tax=Athelia psychrophila TaxID=1759441 RepID=A0A166WKD9_9AGAM|nr:hypothetical protein FIBSPDRAFT_1035822 [Fibularhizoctonia sp. CBS 109695]
MFSPSRSPSLVSIASSNLLTSDEDFNLDSLPLEAVVRIERPTMSEPVEDARNLVQIEMAHEDWAKFQAWEQHRNVPVSTCSAPIAIEKHARFFLPTENIFFLVSNTLYSVPRTPFERHSAAFTGKGLTEDDPFMLADVEVAHFDHFLSILYPSEYGMYTATTVDEWSAVLHIAVRWGFGSIRTLSIKHLAPIATDIDKIVLGRQYGIDQWLHEAFIAVCIREQSLTKEEGRQMTVDDIIEISAIRQLVGPGAQPRQAPRLSIVEACAGFDISQFVSLPTGSERAAHGPAIASDLDVTPHLVLSEQHAISPTDSGKGQNRLGLDPNLNQSNSTPPTTGVDTTVPPGVTSSEEAEESERAQEAAALERAKITERALCAFLESYPIPSNFVHKRGSMERVGLRAMADALRAELTNTVDPRKQQVLDFIASYKAANPALH